MRDYRDYERVAPSYGQARRRRCRVRSRSAGAREAAAAAGSGGNRRMTDLAITRTPTALTFRATPRSGVTVVHAIPGRVRLRAPVLKGASALAESLEAMLKAQAGVTGVNVSRRCQSVTITFDPLCWTPDAL